MAINIAKHIKLPLALLATMAIAGSCTAATVTTSYQRSDENFSNPERGFSMASFSNEHPLTVDEIQSAKKNNFSLIHRQYYLTEFRNSALSQSFLDSLTKDFETARQGGIKLVLRFAYDWEGGQDASKDRILSHLDQLKPVFQANQDVIAFMEAGFIGAWGEWHTSSNQLENQTDKRTILLKILSVLPTQRMVVLRYPHDKIEGFNNNKPLTSQEAFNGSNRARTGGHNDCFVASIDDAGTYASTDPNVIESKKNFLNLDNRYVPQGGETCRSSEYSNCPNTLKELERMHWSQLNFSYQPSVLQGWKDQSCMEEMKRRLGYRFRLIDSSILDKVKPNGTFSMSFKVTNEGWASAYNPRNLEVVLRNKNTGAQYYLPVPEAVRMWMPGETKTVNITGGIPSTMPSGEYQVLLNLPDPTSTLRNRPEYSIRLANQNVWEASTGYNSLLRNVIVDPNAGGDTYSGSQLFKASSGSNSQTPSNNSSQTVTLYEHSNFIGKSQSLGVGTYRADKGQLNQVGNDNVSSLRVPAGYKVRVCSDETGGICREYGAGDYSYVGNDLNDQISLVEVKVQ